MEVSTVEERRGYTGIQGRKEQEVFKVMGPFSEVRGDRGKPGETCRSWPCKGAWGSNRRPVKDLERQSEKVWRGKGRLCFSMIRLQEAQ